MPGPSDNPARVRVRNRHGAEKSVRPGQLRQLLTLGWTEVREQLPKKRPAKQAGDTPTQPAVEPDNDSQEG
jgi:hypothetical protein